MVELLLLLPAPTPCIFGLGPRPEFQGFYNDRSVEMDHFPGPEPVPDIHILVAAPVQF